MNNLIRQSKSNEDTSYFCTSAIFALFALPLLGTVAYFLSAKSANHVLFLHFQLFPFCSVKKMEVQKDFCTSIFWMEVQIPFCTFTL